MFEIVKYPDPILFERMPDFNFNDPIIDAKILIEKMTETMLANSGMGLAANQVGIRTRVFIMGDDKNITAFFNPIIVNAGVAIEDYESCLSFPNIWAKIKRPSVINVKWQDINGEWMETELSGMNCKCFLHEYDHLEGITFKDRISSLKWNMSLKKSEKIKRNQNYVRT